MTYSQLSEASLDLRAPEFSRVRKGGWWVRILTLFACDYICLSIAWVIAESYISFEDFICDPKEQEQYANFIKKENCYTIVGFDRYQALDRYNRKATIEQLNQLEVSSTLNDSSVEQRLDNYLPCCTLKWRQGQLFVSVGQQSEQPYISAFESEQQLVECLKQSPVRLVRLDQTLGEVVLKRWADACEQANKRVFLQRAIQKLPRRQSQSSWQGKQSIDSIAAFVLLIALSPIMLAAAILMYVYSPGAIFSRQWHISPRGKFFRLLKFRTTVANDDSRSTLLVRWMCKYKVDELPQLLNVLRGEISLMDSHPLTLSEGVRFGY